MIQQEHEAPTRAEIALDTTEMAVKIAAHLFSFETSLYAVTVPAANPSVVASQLRGLGFAFFTGTLVDCHQYHAAIRPVTSAKIAKPVTAIDFISLPHVLPSVIGGDQTESLAQVVLRGKARTKQCLTCGRPR